MVEEKSEKKSRNDTVLLKKDFRSISFKRNPIANQTFHSPRRDHGRNYRLDETILQALSTPNQPATNPVLNQTVMPSAKGGGGTFWPDHSLTQRPLYAMT